MPSDWTREEVEATVADYFAMLASELAGVPYNKTTHRRELVKLLDGRSEQAIEFKHGNISAILLDLGFRPIAGYKPRANYQHLLYDVVEDRLASDRRLQEAAAVDADMPIVVPEVDDILAILTTPPPSSGAEPTIGQAFRTRTTNYLERESRNRSLGSAGEEFILNYERARLIKLGRGSLAARIEHTSRMRGDGDGFDILSFEESGADRLIEVKTTKYVRETPFFLSRNELAVSQSRAQHYHLYRLFEFREAPRLFMLSGALSDTCRMTASTYMATTR